MPAGERVRHQREALELQPSAHGQRRDLLRVEQENVSVGIGFELMILVDRRVGALGEFRQVIPKIRAIGRGHDDVTAWPNEGRDAREKLVRMRGVFDHLGDERGVELLLGRIERKGVARRVMDRAELVFQADVISQLFAQIVPGDGVAQLRERE